jgi:hemolysin III
MVGLSWHDDAAKLSSVLVYAMGLLTMLSVSAAYNMSCDFARPPPLRAILRRCDHSAILLMIAATFTPFAMNWSGWHVVAGMWLTIAGAIAFKWLSPSFFERCSVVLFLALAWIAAMIMWPLGAHLPPDSLVALVAGGALYTLGIVFHLWDSLPFQNAIWHGFVLAAAICHYVSILEGIVI